MKSFIHSTYTRSRQGVILGLLFAMLPLMCLAQKITVQGPTRAAVGEQFQLRYIVSTTDVKGFRIGNVPDAFDVLMGPSTSTQQSFSMVNGQTSHTSSVTYTYVLMATKTGTFVIPSAKATVAGKAVASSALKIVVSGQQQGGSGGARRPAQRIDKAGSNISSNDLFIRVTANKHKVYEQEPILLTYKVYTQVELTQLEGKMPELQGFHTQEIPLPQQKKFHTETVNGRPYNCVTWSQYVMYPQVSGKMQIPSITFNGTVVQENPNVDPFEAFFNGGSGFIEVKKSISAASVDIEVMPLPTIPPDFSGGVGVFQITASADKKAVKAGDPVNVKVVVSGTGNMKLIRQPELTLPSDIDKYDPKVTDKTKLSVDGVTGSVVFDNLIVPRNKGKYVIPSLRFVYFDTRENKYKTLTTQPIEIQVTGGSGRGNVTDYSQLNDNDIHDILNVSHNRQNPRDIFFGGRGYLIIICSILLSFVVLFAVFRKRAMILADVTALRGRKANKVAVKRLKKAAKLKDKGKSDEFYDEVLRALWGYVGDKLAMPVEELSRENITERLLQHSVTEEVTGRFVEAIDECEYARYAPGDPVGNMQRTYDKAVTAITDIDNSFNS